MADGDVRLGADGRVILKATGNVTLHDSTCCETCSECAGSTGNAPLAMKVTFAGIVTNGNCTECDDYNLAICVPHTGTDCIWLTDTFTNYCSVDQTEPKHVRVSTRVSGSDYFIKVRYRWGGNSGGGGFLETIYEEPYGTSKPDCQAFNLEDIRYNSESVSGICDTTSSTCKVTAL